MRLVFKARFEVERVVPSPSLRPLASQALALREPHLHLAFSSCPYPWPHIFQLRAALVRQVEENVTR